MFFVMPAFSVLAVYILAAVLPAVFLMRYIYRLDTVEKEPPALLGVLVAQGVLAALAAIVLEGAFQRVLSAVMDSGSVAYTVVKAFLGVAAIEEGAKLFFLRRRTWRDPNFNYRFDGVVYAVFVSLGFAAFENVEYVLYYGLSVALPRALLAIPGHMGFAVFMGVFYGRAKLCADCGSPGGVRANLWAGYLIAVLLHGIYDTCAMLGGGTPALLFAAFVIVMYVAVLRRVRRESRTDMPV